MASGWPGHVKAPNGRPISDEAAAAAASTALTRRMADVPWLQRSLVPINRWSANSLPSQARSGASELQ
jgi:hypothetical protein